MPDAVLLAATTPFMSTLAERWLPASLLARGPLELAWWQWIALPVALLLALAIGKGLGALTRRVLARLASHSRAELDDALVHRMAGPFTWAWTLAVFRALIEALGLAARPHEVLGELIRLGFLVVLFWSLLRLVDLTADALHGSRWARRAAISRSILPLGVRVAKAMVLVIGVITLLSTLGYPVASLIAGLGIGGIAVALAAQKTVSDLIGAFAIGFDQPLREGDFVLVDGTLGTVEAIGLRSTRLRTLDRTLVTVPNGKLADLKIETFAARDKIRLSASFRLRYGTTATQMRAVLTGLECVLREHPRIAADAPSVHFTGVAESWLTVEVMAWFATADWNEFCAIRDDLLLRMLEAIEAAGTALALPTEVVHLASGEPRPPARAGADGGPRAPAAS